MKVMINGREIEVPTHSNGSVDSDMLRQAAGIPPTRALVSQKADGSNQVINPGERVSSWPGANYRDLPLHERGI